MTNEAVANIREKMERPDLRANDFKINEEGRFVLPLEYPFHFGKKEVSELTLRKPKTKHIKKLSAQPTFGELIRVVEVLSDETPSLIDEVDPSDMTKAVEFVGKFF
jgi:hypothetical protein